MDLTREELLAIIDATPVAVWVSDDQARCVGINRHWTEITGQTLTDAQDSGWTEVIEENDRARVVEQVRSAAESNRHLELPLRIRGAHGQIHCVTWKLQPRLDSQSFGIGLVGVLQESANPDALDRRSKQTQIAFDECGESVFWLSVQGDILYVNQHACQKLGYSRDELGAMKLWDIDPLYTKESFQQTDWEQVLGQGRIFRTQHKTRDNRIFPVEVNAKLIHLDEEPFICAFVRDLTDLIRIDSELELMRQRLEEALHSGNIGLWDWNIQTGEVHYSSEWKTQIGLAPDAQLEGYPDWEARVHPDDLDAAVQRLNDYLEGKTPDYVSTFRFRHEDGTYRWIRAEGRLLRNESGEPERMIGVHVDMTDQKHAEIALGIRTAELEAIFQASPDVFLRTDRDGTIRDYRVSNDAVLLMNPQKFLGQRIQQFMPGRVSENYDQALRLVNETDDSQTIEYRIPTKGGYAWHQAVLRPFQSDSIAIFVRDISELKSSQADLLLRTRELERSNADLDQFAYVASHDLKTPLRGIQHLTKWIREDAEGKLPAACDDHLDRLDQQVSRMQNLLDDLLQYSRAGRVRVTVEPIDLKEMFQEIVSLLPVPRAMSLVLESPEDLNICTGRAPLFHVLYNLVENAVKYHDRRHGQVIVRVSRAATAEFVQFEVIDDGPGIAPEHHARIFRMFQRLESTITGTGMGLAVVRKMIESRGGSIELESKLGSGATFTFTWPAMRDLPDLESDED